MKQSMKSPWRVLYSMSQCICVAFLCVVEPNITLSCVNYEKQLHVFFKTVIELIVLHVHFSTYSLLFKSCLAFSVDIMQQRGKYENKSIADKKRMSCHFSFNFSSGHVLASLVGFPLPPGCSQPL